MQLPPVVTTVLRSVAPTLLTALALPPPFNMIASAVVSGVIAKYLPPDQAPAAGSPPPVLAPKQVTEIIEQKADDPNFILELRQAEADLKKYELDSGIRFAELEIKDRQRAGEFQQAAGLSPRIFTSGIIIVGIAIFGMVLMIAGSLILVFSGAAAVDPTKANIATAAFGLIGTAVGFINGIAATIVTFYWGSSQSSKEKSDAINETVRDLGAQLGKAAASAPTPPPKPSGLTPAASGPVFAPPSTPAEQSRPATPTPPGVLPQVINELVKPHRHFPDGVEWALVISGISVDGAPPQGTPGAPTTVRNIWQRYGKLISTSARNYGVPVELITATIATESSGRPDARRSEPQINDESVGLMQTLVGTARQATGRRDLKGDDLLDPATSIEAGTAYIAQQRSPTHFDPPLVAAAYNAGSVRRDAAEQNRWRLLCFPKGTGAHVDRFVAFFSDSMQVSSADDWSDKGSAPSFAAELSANTPGVRVVPSGRPEVDTSGPDFPPPPSFPPLVSLADKQRIFGTFTFVPDPQPDNHEHIRVTNDWFDQNIVKVRIPVLSVFGKPGPLEIDFHKLAADQLIGLWLEWEKEGLLQKVLTFDGGYVPRFIRGSTSVLSNHAFGTAFDINASFNPLRAQPALVGQQGSVRELVPTAYKFGFFWGGLFKHRPDGMHFEIAELLPGVHPNAVEQPQVA